VRWKCLYSLPFPTLPFLTCSRTLVTRCFLTSNLVRELQIAHYRKELREFLASWRGSDAEMKHLYGQSSPAFRNWLDTVVYKNANQRLSQLLHGELRRETFSQQQLQDMGWPV
jgi:hypothetical protein